MNARRQISTRTNAEVRAAIRDSSESLRVLAERYSINPKTAAKWKKRGSPEDLRSGPKRRHGSITTEEEEIIVRFREHTLLPLDDCLYALQAQIPHLSRSSLHRCFQKHGISRLYDLQKTHLVEEPGTIPPGWLHIDFSAIRSVDGTHYLFNAIDQASKFVCVRMGAAARAADAAAFLGALVERLPFAIARVITLDAEPFVAPGGESPFAQMCEAHGIEHHLTVHPHPWTRGQDTRIGRMIDDSLTFASAAYVADLLRQFVHAYNFRRRLKTLGGRTPYEFLCQTAAEHPSLFLRQPHHEMVGLEIMTR